MTDFDLQMSLAKLVESLLPDDELRQQRANASVISLDGRVLPSAVAGALPWQAHDGKIDGTVATGSNRMRWHFPQGGVIRQVSYDVRTAPSGGALEFTISGGSSTQTFSLQSGKTSDVANTGIVMSPGSWARVNILSANGAADLAVTLQYESAGTGSTVSGGGGGGGGGTISVISVNGQTGVVELNADDIPDDTTTHKFVSAAEKAKLASFEPGDYVLASSLALVATSGDYDDLDNKPTLGTAAAMDSGDFATDTQGAKADTAVQPGDLADVATSGDYDDLDNKPTIPAQFNPIAGANMSITGTYPDITFNASGGGGGGGDMFKSVYDPTSKAADAFDMGNMAESASAKILTSAERTKLANIENGAQVNVQSDWNASSGDALILNKPSIYTQAEVDEMMSKRVRVIRSFRHASDPVSTTSIDSNNPYWWDNEATGIVRYIDLTAGTWEFEVYFAMKIRRSVTTGGVWLCCSVDGQQFSALDYQTTPRDQFFFTADARRVVVDVVSPRTIAIRLGFCGWSTAGTTYGYHPLLTGTYQRL